MEKVLVLGAPSIYVGIVGDWTAQILGRPYQYLRKLKEKLSSKPHSEWDYVHSCELSQKVFSNLESPFLVISSVIEHPEHPTNSQFPK